MSTKKPSVGDQIEYGLQEQNKSTTTETPKERPIDPAVEIKIDAWIKKFPERHKDVVDMGLEWLVRREIHRKIKREEALGREAERIFEILSKDEALRQRVEDKIRNIPEERLEKARYYVAKDLIASDAIDETLKTKASTSTP